MNKPKTNYASKSDQINEKDCFETPAYATKILLPFIPEHVNLIWECAAGSGRISDVLFEFGKYDVRSTDLKDGYNFLECDSGWYSFDAIITNPPYSKKKEFAYKCIDHGVPWSLLVPFDMSRWMCDLIKNHGAQFIIPNTRINFITPNVLTRVYEGELFRMIKKLHGIKEKSLNTFKQKYSASWLFYIMRYSDHHNYKSVEDVPASLLSRYSAAQMHTAWMCCGFDLPNQLNVVELTQEMKLDI